MAAIGKRRPLGRREHRVEEGEEREGEFHSLLLRSGINWFGSDPSLPSRRERTTQKTEPGSLHDSLVEREEGQEIVDRERPFHDLGEDVCVVRVGVG
jgi:hypothetical protein